MSFFTDLPYHERPITLFYKNFSRDMIMSRIVPAEEFNMIEQLISEYPEGIGISALETPIKHIYGKNWGHF